METGSEGEILKEKQVDCWVSFTFCQISTIYFSSRVTQQTFNSPLSDNRTVMVQIP